MKDFELITNLKWEFDVSFPETNQNYQEILKLEQLLISSSIPYRKERLFDGWKITYFSGKEEISDVIEHFGSRYSDKDLLEIMHSELLCKCEFLNLIIDNGKLFASPVAQGYRAIDTWLLWSMDFHSRSLEFNTGGYMRTWREILRREFPTKLHLEVCRVVKTAYDLAVCGMNYQKSPENFEYMSGYDLTFLSVAAVIVGKADFFLALTKYQGRKHLMSYVLDILIPFAIAKEQHEIQLLLTDYKYRNGIFRRNKLHL